jgi:hypothetical protein
MDLKVRLISVGIDQFIGLSPETTEKMTITNQNS